MDSHATKTRAIFLALACVVAAVSLVLAFLVLTNLKTVLAYTILPPRITPKTAYYVAIGDSYTAAPELHNQISVSTPPGCNQSDANYPHLVAAASEFPSITDMSCSGAFANAVERPQLTADGTNAAQGKALSGSTRIVTVSLGGNDSEILPLLFDCVGSATRQSNCREKYLHGATDEVAAKMDAIEPLVESMLDEVKTEAPNAKILVVGYPQIFPADGSSCPAEMPFTGGDLAYFSYQNRRMNAAIERAAKSRGATFVDTYGPSKGHDVCSGRAVRWIESCVPVAPAFVLHPNVRGERGLAAAVLKALSDA